MKTYLCKWPDKTISVLTAKSERDLFFKLDSEADPSYPTVRIYKLPVDFQITTKNCRVNYFVQDKYGSQAKLKRVKL